MNPTGKVMEDDVTLPTPRVTCHRNRLEGPCLAAHGDHDLSCSAFRA